MNYSEAVEELTSRHSNRKDPAKDSTKETLNLLNNPEQDYDIILVTARGADLRDLTAEWLAKHQIPYDELIHSDQKADVCKQKGIELFIDDRLKNLLPIKKRLKIPVLLMTMTHNQDYEGEIPRVKNWREVKERITHYFG